MGELQRRAVFNTAFLVIIAQNTFWTLAGPNFFGTVRFKHLCGVLKESNSLLFAVLNNGQWTSEKLRVQNFIFRVLLNEIRSVKCAVLQTDTYGLYKRTRMVFTLVSVLCGYYRSRRFVQPPEHKQEI